MTRKPSVLHSLEQLNAQLYASGRKLRTHIIRESPTWGRQTYQYLENLSARPRIKDLFLIITLFIISFSAYNRSAVYFATTDALPNTLTTLNIIRHHRLDITNIQHELDKRDLKGIYVKNEQGKVYPKTSVLLGIMGVPFYSFMHWWWDIPSYSDTTMIDSFYSQFLGKIYASLLTSLSVIFVYGVLRRIKLSRQTSWIMACLYALCTNVFNIASQSNIQHGISLFLVTGALLLFFTQSARRITRIASVLFAGFLIGISTHIRISNGFYSVFFCLLIIGQWIKDTKTRHLSYEKFISYLTGFALGYVPYMLLMKPLNIPMGYQEEILFSFKIWSFSQFLQNIYALLFSYNYGLFVFSPIFIIILIALVTRRKVAVSHKLLMYLSYLTILIFIAFAGSWWMWSGGLSLGARLIIEAIPLGILLMGIYFEDLSRLPLFKLQLLTLVLISIYFNILTTYTFDKSWHDQYTIPGHANQIRNAWFDKPALLVYLMQHQFYIESHIQRKQVNGKTALFIHRKRYWGNGYDRILKLMKDEEYQVLPIPQ